MKWFINNEVDEATVTEENSNLNFPPSNVKDSRLSTIYKGGEQINFDITGAGSIKNISQAYTNLVQDPTDLRAAGANWTAVNTTDAISTLSINGNLFTQIINSGANKGYNYQAFTDTFTNLTLTGSIIIKKGSAVGNDLRFVVFDTTAVANKFFVVIDFDNFGSSPGTPTFGTILEYTWYDSETLKINFECDTLVDTGGGESTNDLQVRCFGSDNATDGEYMYYTEVQLIDHDAIVMFPFVDGTHSVDEIDETFNTLAQNAQTAVPISVGIGIRTKNTPSPVATPFPPSSPKYAE